MEKLTDSPLRLSRFAHILCEKSYNALFHSLTIEIIFLSSRAIELVSEFKIGKTTNNLIAQKELNRSEAKSFNRLVEKLVELKMLVPLSYSENEELIGYRETYLRKPVINMAYLVLTDYCNLRCGYCFVEKDNSAEYKFSYMSPNAVRQSLDLFAKWTAESKSLNKTVIFYGGEPLLNKEAFCAALKYIAVLKKRKMLPENLEVSMITNGTLIDKNTAYLIKDYNVFVGLSIDGMPETHDKYRYFTGDMGSFGSVERGYGILKEAGIDISVSVTMTPDNTKDLLKHVQWLVKRFEPKGVGLNLLMDSADRIISSPEYAEIATEQMIKCFEFLRSIGLHEDRMMRKIESFTRRRVYPYDCGGCGRQVVFLPNGKVSMCQAYICSKKFSFSPKSKFSPYANDEFRNWANRSPLTMPQCLDCFALGICGGGCPARADFRNGSLFSLDDIFCVHAKKVIRWMIEDLNAQDREGKRNGKQD